MDVKAAFEKPTHGVSSDNLELSIAAASLGWWKFKGGVIS
jgi:hypothetical protein